MNHLVLDGPAATTGASGTLSFVALADWQAYIKETGDAGGPIDTRHRIVLDSALHSAFSLMGGRFLLRPSTAFSYVLSPFDDGSTLFLSQYPVGTITAIETGYMSADGVWTNQNTIDTDNYYADKASGRVYGVWPVALHSVRVEWDGGYIAAEVPADAKEAVMAWAAVKWQRVKRTRWDVKTLSGASEGYSYIDTDLPAASEAVLRKYAMPTVSVS